MLVSWRVTATSAFVDDTTTADLVATDTVTVYTEDTTAFTATEAKVQKRRTSGERGLNSRRIFRSYTE